jgi:hypothetical protein
MSTVHYEQIWWAFSAEIPAAQKFFNPLFYNNSIIRQPIRVVGPFPEHPPRDIQNKHYFWISYSGESFHQPTQLGMYDVHFIMKPTDFQQRIVWLPLFTVYAYEEDAWPKMMIPRELIIPKQKFCAMVVSDSRGDVRNAFFHKLNAIQKIDSVGNWLNNTGFILPRGDEKKPGYLSDYKFIMCFENKVMSHYMTEKLLHAYVAGAIPIYAGASVSREILNPEAFLYLEDTSEEGMNRLIQQILYLDQNPEAYKKMYCQPLLKTPEIPREMTIEYLRECMEQFAR